MAAKVKQDPNLPVKISNAYSWQGWLVQIAASEQLAIERKCLIQLFFRLGLGVGGEVAPALSRHHGGGVVGEDEEEEGEGGGRGGATSGKEGED